MRKHREFSHSVAVHPLGNYLVIIELIGSQLVGHRDLNINLSIKSIPQK